MKRQLHAALVIAALSVVLGDLPSSADICGKAVPYYAQSWEWCWAANMQMVGAWYNCYKDQCRYVEDFYQWKNHSGGGCCDFATCWNVAPTISEYQSFLAFSSNPFFIKSSAFISVPAPYTVAEVNRALSSGPDGCHPIIAVLEGTGNTVNAGHALTLTAITFNSQFPDDSVVAVNDPANGQRFPFYRALTQGGYNTFYWKWAAEVTDVGCPLTSVADIQDFSATDSTVSHNVVLDFHIAGNFQQRNAVYVSDNPAGPAQLIEPLTATGGAHNRLHDTLRLPPAGPYYYWLDHDNTFAVKRNPDGLFPSSSVPSITGSPASRPVRAAPTQVVVTDVPYDEGTSMSVSWQLSADNALLDGYNLYRRSYPGGHPEQGVWGWVASVPKGTTSYTDNSAQASKTNEYKVSSSHHGNYSLQQGDGNSGLNSGIWNDFSGAAAAQCVDNFSVHQVTLVSNDTLTVCPGGDRDHFQTELTVWGSNLQPTVGAPASMLLCYVTGDTLWSCPGTLIANSPTDAQGKTTFTASRLGGHGAVTLTHGLINSYRTLGIQTVYLRSPDENGNGIVDLPDLSLFSATYPTNQYRWWRDYNGSHHVDLGDFTLFCSNYNHSCASPPQPTSPANVLAGASVRLNYVEETSATSGRTFFVDVSLVDVPKFSVACVMLRNETPGLEFARWETGAFPGRVIAAPIERDGVGEIALGIYQGEALKTMNTDLGRLAFNVSTDNALQLTSRDFEVRVADILTAAGQATIGSRAATTSGAVPRVVRNELAQNRPNPFNPATTISYSIAQAGHVELSVFGVDGRRVRTLVDEVQGPDVYRINWDGTDIRGAKVASGVYFCRISSPHFSATRKMVLLK